MESVDSFRTTTKIINVGQKSYSFFSLKLLEQNSGLHISHLPFSIKILLENLLRKEDGVTVKKEDIINLINWDPKNKSDKEISFSPSRVLLQDFTGVPCVVDLALMRDAIIKLGGNPDNINPLQPVDLVIDHSIQVDEYASSNAFKNNSALEYERNKERYAFLRWGQQSFKNFRVVPPSSGIVHQINLEFLANLVFSSQTSDAFIAYPDSVVGTDSHTTMINGLGVIGWGVGGIEAEAVMLGQPISMLIPEVIGFKLTGKLNPTATATDLVLTITNILRKKGVVGKFVEFYGEGLSSLSLADRATVANMAPEYGATMGYFPVDEETINFLKLTSRSSEQIELVEKYFKEQGLFYNSQDIEPHFSDVVELNLSSIEPCIAGPKRPQDKINLSKSKTSFRASLIEILENKGVQIDKPSLAQWVYYLDDSIKPDFLKSFPVELNGTTYNLEHGSIILAAITSCTNTSNPSVIIAAGLLAKKAVELGLKSKPWVKTSFAPGSKVVTEYLAKANLTEYLDALGFNLVGYGCTTCIGNSGPINQNIQQVIKENNLVVASVLSGNRNFEGRVHPSSIANYLASPPLVVAYALYGNMDINFLKDPIGTDKNGQQVFLKDIMPTVQEIEQTLKQCVNAEQYKKGYENIFVGSEQWQALQSSTEMQYKWDEKSTYIKPAPYFENLSLEPTPLQDISNAKVLVMLGDSVTTDHISPAGAFDENSSAGKYLTYIGINKKDFNQYGARRGNHEIMMRGTFANIRLKNLMLNGIDGGFTLHSSSSEPIAIYDAAIKYKQEGIPLVVIAGKDYGCGSSRDWAAKGPALLGVKAIIAESFERIHRSNLIGMGILPLQFEKDQNANTLGLTGLETYSINGISQDLKQAKKIIVTATTKEGVKKSFTTVCRIDTPNEVEYYKNGGILHYVLRSLVNKKEETKQPLRQAQKQTPQIKTAPKKYKIIFNGEIDEDKDINTVKNNLEKYFKTNTTQIEKLFTGKSITISKDLDFDKTQDFIKTMKSLGAICYFEPMITQPQTTAQLLPRINKPTTTTNKPIVKPITKTGVQQKSAQEKVINTSKKIAHHSNAYMVGWIASASGITLLYLFYFALTFYIAFTTADLIIDGSSISSNKSFNLITNIIFIVLGLIFTTVLIKPFVISKNKKNTTIVLSRKREFNFYTYIDKLAISIGAIKPDYIEIDSSADVEVKYKRGFLGFLEDKIILTIGLPLISQTTKFELTNLIAHELAHFADKLNMRLYFIITIIKTWLKDVSSNQDFIDNKLQELTTNSVNPIVRISANILATASNIHKKFCNVLWKIAKLITNYHSREMELEADRYSVRYTSPAIFNSSLQKLSSTHIAVNKAIESIYNQSASKSNKFANFIELVNHFANKEQNESNNVLTRKQEILSDQERINNVKNAIPKTSLDEDTEASSFLFDYSIISNNLTSLIYKNILNVNYDKNNVVPVQEFLANQNEKNKDVITDKEINEVPEFLDIPESGNDESELNNFDIKPESENEQQNSFF